MTQLFIAGIEAVLPQSFSVTVKRENPFFTKSGEYTYDCTLRLDNTANLQLYGFLNRLNKSDSVQTNRTAQLMADGHVYCRGTEVITKWTEQTVSIQIVSGESELNFFIGQDRKIEDLDLGSITGTVRSGAGLYPAADYCETPIRLATGEILNDPFGGHRATAPWTTTDERPQPYLCALIRRIVSALGYTIGVNQLENTQFKNLFLVNTVQTIEYAKMLPGWTVKDFLEEVEKLTGCVFITDNTNPASPQCDIVLKTVFYQDARQLPLANVTDSYETEVVDGNGSDAEFTASDVNYDLPDNYWTKMMKLPDGFLESAEVVDYADLATLMASEFNTEVVKHDLSTGRYYINVTREYEVRDGAQVTTQTDSFTVEVNQFRNLDRANSTSELELKITPAPMAYIGKHNFEMIVLGGNNGYKSTAGTFGNFGGSDSSSSEESNDGDTAEAESTIQSFEKKESATVDLYCAFGCSIPMSVGTGITMAYTDANHAKIQRTLYPWDDSVYDPLLILLEGSLRLQDLDSDYYQGGYQIDTAHAVTFETFDPNSIDVRQVYVIKNRRYVVRDAEETITAEGRQKKWKLTCYPIDISDTAIENRWVLTRGVWDDGGAWLDDGRWNDTDPLS
jgi:hypothetical protein